MNCTTFEISSDFSSKLGAFKPSNLVKIQLSSKVARFGGSQFTRKITRYFENSPFYPIKLTFFAVQN